jgi:phosphatidylglycerol:prolipoprotein diacylglycerol transferase
MWNLVGLIIVTLILLRTKKYGVVTSFYLVYYGIGRALIEGLRTDSLYLGNTGLRVSQVLSIVLILVGIGLFVYTARKQRKTQTKKVGVK